MENRVGNLFPEHPSTIHLLAAMTFSVPLAGTGSCDNDIGILHNQWPYGVSEIEPMSAVYNVNTLSIVLSLWPMDWAFSYCFLLLFLFWVGM